MAFVQVSKQTHIFVLQEQVSVSRCPEPGERLDVGEMLKLSPALREHGQGERAQRRAPSPPSPPHLARGLTDLRLTDGLPRYQLQTNIPTAVASDRPTDRFLCRLGRCSPGQFSLARNRLLQLCLPRNKHSRSNLARPNTNHVTCVNIHLPAICQPVTRLYLTVYCKIK